MNTKASNKLFRHEERQDLSFLGEKLIRGRHKIHPYPAMLHPLLVDYLLDNYSTNKSVILDPYCGSGVTLVQSGLRGNDSIGFDVNPLAILVAETKTKNFKINKLNEEYKYIIEKFKLETSPDIPEITNISYWYKEDVINDLGKIRSVLKKEKLEYKKFFLTIFAYLCRHQSLTRNSEFKRYRMSQDRIEKFDNQVFELFSKQYELSINEFSKDSVSAQSKIYLLNSEIEFPKNIKYDLVITSPPYGDSGTTVAYGQYSSFAHNWISDFEEYRHIKYKVDRETMGKKREIVVDLDKFLNLKKAVDEIKKHDEKRSNDVLNFYNGYYMSLKNIYKHLSKNGFMCIVVGNRTVKGYKIPMDQITGNFLDHFGMKFGGIFIRDISNKVMPLRNSPSNKIGENSSTMSNEYIVVFKKN